MQTTYGRKVTHDVYSIFDDARGMDDEEIITQALLEDRILITHDKDFGRKVFQDRRGHREVILLRLHDEETSTKINVIQSLIELYPEGLPRRFIVASENRIRFARE